MLISTNYSNKNNQSFQANLLYSKGSKLLPKLFSEITSEVPGNVSLTKNKHYPEFYDIFFTDESGKTYNGVGKVAANYVEARANYTDNMALKSIIGSLDSLMTKAGFGYTDKNPFYSICNKLNNWS